MNKVFKVDWDDIKALNNLRIQVRTRLNELEGKDSLKKKQRLNKEQVFNSCINIYNADISNIYRNICPNSKKDFYVYCHLDPSTSLNIKHNPLHAFAATLGMEFLPFYIGKGVDNRCYDFNRNETHRKIRQKITKLDKEVQVIKVKESLFEHEALALESKLIDIFGLIPYGGKLTNLDEGIKSEERKSLYKEDLQNLSLFNKGMIK